MDIFRGSFVHIASFTYIIGSGEFVMEDFTGLSSGIRVYTGNEDYLGGSLINPAFPHPHRVPIRSFMHIKNHASAGENIVVRPVYQGLKEQLSTHTRLSAINVRLYEAHDLSREVSIV